MSWRSPSTRFPNRLRAASCPPWLVDRIFRHILVDVTGNTHRTEFCIDKLYSPDSATGRLGLLELRGFEMPPHARMSLAQQLLVRGLIAWFWKEPYTQKPIHWGTRLHDQFMLPHFVAQDFREVLADLNRAGYAFESRMVRAAFRVSLSGVRARSSCRDRHGNPAGDRALVRAGRGRKHRRHRALCGFLGRARAGPNRGVYRKTATWSRATDGACRCISPGKHGEWVAGVRYRAWQPPSCLHPTIPVHTPLVFDILDLWTGRSVGGCTLSRGASRRTQPDHVPGELQRSRGSPRVAILRVRPHAGADAGSAAGGESGVSPDARLAEAGAGRGGWSVVGRRSGSPVCQTIRCQTELTG